MIKGIPLVLLTELYNYQYSIWIKGMRIAHCMRLYEDEHPYVVNWMGGGRNCLKENGGVRQGKSWLKKIVIEFRKRSINKITEVF